MNLPSGFISKYQTLLGSEAAAFFEALTNGSYQKAFRENPLKPAYQEMVAAHGFANFPKAPYAKDAFLGKVSGKSPLHQAGYVYSQEPSAMLVATVLAAQPGEKVLDLCAAPGGKSTQILSQLNNQGLLVSNEIFSKRAKILSENIERWGGVNSLVTNHAPAELVGSFSGFFDKILVDAPCSGEGMFRKDNVAIEEWQENSSEVCAVRQKEILSSALKMLKSQGTLVYSTCTFAPEENEEIVSWLVENYPLTIAEINYPETEQGRPEWGSVPDLAKTARIWPHKNIGEGHFVAKLIFQGTNEETQAPKSKKKQKNSQKAQIKLTKEENQLVDNFLETFPLTAVGERIKFGEQVWQLPAGLTFSQIEKLKLIRPGLHLGTIKKNRFEPSFALSMTAPATWPAVSITEEYWQHYVAGETFSLAGNQGWLILAYDKMPIGFGKQVQGVIKNFYPKGLRFKV